MPEQVTHPSHTDLHAYGLGQLPPDEATAIERHISECEPCCETIADLSSADTFIELLQNAEQEPNAQTADHPSDTTSPNSAGVPEPLAKHPRYEIVGLIGKGGMGDVYKATHRMMDRTVALKIIKRELMQNSQAVDRFHREVKAAAKLSHPNIVTSHDAEQAGDVHFLVMEYVDGVDLSQIVKDQGALSVADACDYIRQAAIGLQHAHEHGMVHRDIKPHNLMVTKHGTVKILDFGLASLAPEAIADADTVEARGDLTAAGTIMGTPDFISPEQAEDARTADIRSDIYSLGATLYFLLSAQPPFAEGSVMHKLKSHAQSDPEPLSTVRLDVPADLADVITRMMAKDPDERFQTPEELAEALKPFSQLTEPREIVEPPTQAEWRRWPPKFLSLTAVGVLFVAALFAGVFYYVQTDYGVVRVEVTDPSLEVTINDQTISMQDEDGKKLTIRPGKQTLIIRKDDADFEFETDRFQIRRGNKVAFEVEMLQGEIVVHKDGARFQSKALSDNIGARQILDRMTKAYAECKSYRDSGVIKSVFLQNAASPEFTVEYAFDTAFVRPDRFRFEIKDQDDDKLLISSDGEGVQSSWDIEPGNQKPESLELAMAQAVGFTGGDVGRIPAMLMPKKIDGWVDLDLIDPIRIEDGKLHNVECFRLECSFRDEQVTLWVDKQSYLVRRIDERILSDDIRIERTTTYDPTIDGKITDEMLAFAPSSLRAVDDRADLLPPDVEPEAQTEQHTRNLLDTTYISNDTVGLLVAHPQRILSRESAVKGELDQRLAKVAETEGLDVRNLNQIVVQLGPPPLSSRPIRNFFDEHLWTVVLRFDEPVDVESYIDQHAQGYTKTKHKHETYYKRDSRMALWFPDNRTLIIAAERRILSLIDNPEGTGPMAMRMRRAEVTNDLLLEIDVRQAGPLLLESLPSEAQAPEVYPVIEQTVEKLKRISLTVKQTADTPIRARFEAIDAEKANQLHALASVWFETAKGGWPKVREMIRERPAEKDTKLANALAEQIDAVLPATWLAIDKDQLLVRVEKQGGVDLAALLVFFLLID